jgi:hypothetical protein
MAQPTKDQLQAILDKAAAAILSGNALDDTTRLQAAGCGVKLAGDDADEEMLNLLILVMSGNYVQAAAALMTLAININDDAQGNDDGPDPLAGIMNGIGTGTTGPASAARPGPRPAKKAAAPVAPTVEPDEDDQSEPAQPATPVRSGRRGRR